MSVAVALTPTDPTVCIGDAQLMKIVSEKTLERVRAEYEHDRRQRGVEHGECFCGCGQRTAIARDTSIKRGWVRGMPVRFVSTHHVRLGMITTGPKQCRDCLKFLPRTEFYKDSQRGKPRTPLRILRVAIVRGLPRGPHDPDYSGRLQRTGEPGDRVSLVQHAKVRRDAGRVPARAVEAAIGEI
jgi:hypothetical protein